MLDESSMPIPGPRIRKLFDSPYEQFRDRIGQPFTVVARITEPDATHDVECLPMFRIRFESDGMVIDAWPEEVEDSTLYTLSLPRP